MDNPPVIPARLRHAIFDALADTGQLQQRLDDARQAAVDVERILENAHRSGFLPPGTELLEHCRMMTSAAHAAAAAALKVAEDMHVVREPTEPQYPGGSSI